MSLGVVRQGIVEVRLKPRGLLNKSSVRAHLLVLRAQSPRGRPRLELYTVPHGQEKGGSRVRVCRSALQVISAEDVVSIQEAKPKSKPPHGVQLFMVTEKMMFFCKSEFQQKRWIEDISRVFFEGSEVVQPVDPSKSDIYAITLAKSEGGVWKAETNALMEIGSSNIVVFTTSSMVNPLYMLPLANVASVCVVGEGYKDEMRELKITTKGEKPTEFILWSFLCEDIAHSLSKRIEAIGDSQIEPPLMFDSEDARSVSPHAISKCRSASHVIDIPSVGDYSTSVPNATYSNILEIPNSATQAGDRKVRTASMKSKNLRRFGSDSDLRVPESSQEENNYKDNFFCSRPARERLRANVIRSRSDNTHHVVKCHITYTNSKGEALIEDNVSSDEDSDDYSKISEIGVTLPNLLHSPEPRQQDPASPTNRYVSSTTEDRQAAALKPMDIREIKQLQQKLKLGELRPAERDNKSRSPDVTPSADPLHSPRAVTALKPRPAPRQRSHKPVPQNRPTPPPKPKLQRTDDISNTKPKTVHASNCSQRSSSASSNPCNCGALEETTEVPIRGLPSHHGVCGEETTERGSYSYIMIRGSENQTGKKPQNPIFPEDMTKRVNSDVRQKQKKRAPAVLPRPSHTLSDKDGEETYIEFTDGGQEISDDALTVSLEDVEFQHHDRNASYDDSSNCLYQNIDSYPGDYENITADLIAPAHQSPPTGSSCVSSQSVGSTRQQSMRSSKSSEHLYFNVFDEGPYENVRGSSSGW